MARTFFRRSSARVNGFPLSGLSTISLAATAKSASQTQATADLAAERTRADKAIAAFAALAERLDALAAERVRPWWRRLVG